jgi:hypothetical protein
VAEDEEDEEDWEDWEEKESWVSSSDLGVPEAVEKD